jgi:hypothetical protein
MLPDRLRSGYFLSFINHSPTYRTYPIIFMLFHIGGTTTGTGRRDSHVLEFIHIVVLIMA